MVGLTVSQTNYWRFCPLVEGLYYSGSPIHPVGEPERPSTIPDQTVLRRRGRKAPCGTQQPSHLLPCKSLEGCMSTTWVPLTGSWMPCRTLGPPATPPGQRQVSQRPARMAGWLLSCAWIGDLPTNKKCALNKSPLKFMQKITTIVVWGSPNQ